MPRPLRGLTKEKVSFLAAASRHEGREAGNCTRAGHRYARTEGMAVALSPLLRGSGVPSPCCLVSFVASFLERRPRL
jgi:hypothetical protein